MKKIISVLSTAVFCLVFCGCEKADTKPDVSKKEQISIYDRGLEIVQMLDEQAKDENYSKVFAGSDEITQLGQEIAKGDYSSPKAVYEISFDDEQLLKFVNAYEDVKDFSGNLKDMMKTRVKTSLINVINAQSGVEYVAAAGVYTANKIFVSDELNQDKIFIYMFDNTYPVSISFVKGEDNAVSANGCFIFDKDLNSMSKEDIEKSFEDKIPIDFSIIDCNSKQ